ncbi:hypothetical protein [Bradyrhizobium sp.]|uniref:hypothetical protein n=1 Tax=Bradyrhizobium sp. TaxID=376 RepID=UPI003C46BA5C
MSDGNEQEQVGPHDPLHYAPRRLRERPEQRSATGEDNRSQPQKRPEPGIRPIQPPAPIDSQLESAVYESLRRPLEPQVLVEPQALARELDKRNAIFGVAGRLAAAIGVSAVIALFFVIMMPASRQSDAQSTFQASVQQFSAGLAQAHPAEDTAASTAKPALAEFQSLLTTTASADQAAAAPAPADNKLLQQFMQWRQKGNSPGSAQQ